MEVISLKLEMEMLKNIDNSLKKHNFGTRTEFIRSAVREKLDELNQKEALDKFLALRGSGGKKKFSWKEYRKVREQVGEEFRKERGWN